MKYGTKSIRKNNDWFRTTGYGGEVYITEGVQALHLGDAVITAVAKFDDFNEDNDPYGEHDFGEVVVDGHRIWWKIDYYDREKKFGSPDPLDASLTTLVMTIYLPDEH